MRYVILIVVTLKIAVSGMGRCIIWYRFIDISKKPAASFMKIEQVNQDGLKLNGTHQLLDYADAVNILGGSVHTVKKNAETLVAATKEIGLEVNPDKTKCMIMSRDHTGRSHSMKIDNTRVGYKVVATLL